MKRLALALLVVLLVFSMSACNESQETLPDNDGSNDPGNVQVDTKTYYEVVYSEGLYGALTYLDINYDDFNEESLNEYKEALREALEEKVTKYSVFLNIEKEQIPAPITIDNVDYLYPNIFKSEDYTFNINTLDTTMKEISLEIRNDDVFTLYKAYWNTEGYVEDMGFAAVVSEEAYNIIQSRLLNDENDYIEGLNYYTDIIVKTDTSFSSEAKYPIVLLEHVGNISLFEDLDKVTLYLPLEIIDRPIAVDNPSNTPDSSDTSQNSNPTAIPENKVIKNYTGAGVDQLNVIEYDFNNNQSTVINKNLAIFGKIYDVEIGRIKLYTEGWFESLQKYDELEDTLIVLLDCPFNDEHISSYMVYISFYDEDLNYHTIGFSGAEDKKDSFISSFDINETILETGGPTQVTYTGSESAILDVVNGSNSDFTLLYLVDNYDQYADQENVYTYLTLDSRMTGYYEEEYNVTTIPLWVSSNMYNIEVTYSNFGEVVERSSKVKNVKAGSWLICKAILEGDGEAYQIKFQDSNGRNREIFITTDESGEFDTINGVLIETR